MEVRHAPFTDAYIRTFRAVDGLERRSGLRSFIDIDLAQPSRDLDPRVQTLKLANRSQAIVALQNLARRADRSTQEDEYAYQTLKSAIAYFQVLEGLQMPFEEKVMTINGTNPLTEDVLLTEIALQRAHVADLSQSLGYPYTREGYNRFVRQERLTREEVMREFHETEEWFLPILKEHLTLVPEYNFGYKTKFEPVKEYWFNWVSAIRTGRHVNMLFRLNTHKDHQRGLVRGNAERLAPHEIGGHVAQATLWKDAIRGGLLAQTSGIITIPSLLLDHSEGIAGSIGRWIPETQENTSQYGRFSTERVYLSELVMAYVDQTIDTSQKSDDELEVEMRGFWNDHCPSDELAKVDRRIANFMRSPWHQLYLYNYGTGNYFYRRMADQLTQDQRDTLLKEFYSTPMTPSQVTERFNAVLDTGNGNSKAA